MIRLSLTSVIEWKNHISSVHCRHYSSYNSCGSVSQTINSLEIQTTPIPFHCLSLISVHRWLQRAWTCMIYSMRRRHLQEPSLVPIPNIVFSSWILTDSLSYQDALFVFWCNKVTLVLVFCNCCTTVVVLSQCHTRINPCLAWIKCLDKITSCPRVSWWCRTQLNTCWI